MNYNIFGKTIRNYRNRVDLKVCLRWKFICKVVVISISLPKAITCEGLISKNWERELNVQQARGVRFSLLELGKEKMYNFDIFPRRMKIMFAH